MIACINFFILLSFFGTTRGFHTLLFRTGINSKMATQKTMRGFFAVQKDSINSSNKKPKIDAVAEVIISASSTSSATSPGASTALTATSSSSSSNEMESNNNNKPDKSDKPLVYPPSLTDEEWKSKLSQEFSKPYFKTLSEFVDKEYEKGPVYPPRNEIYSAFNLCPFNDIKVRSRCTGHLNCMKYIMDHVCSSRHVNLIHVTR